MKSMPHKNNWSIVIKMGMFPFIFYFICFCLLTFPLILKFSTHVFGNYYDGLKNIWNLWWINKSITQLQQSPFYTTYLHYPHGTSLVGHTLNPFNGLISIVLLKFMTLIQTYNFIVIFSFTISGLTMFILAYYITKSYLASILAGAIFTFSSYHFAHTQAGHLNLVSLEWIPLFILFWFKLFTKPQIVTAIASAIILLAIILCDYYYFFYSIIIGCIIFIWFATINHEPFFFLKRRYLIPLSTFFFTCFVTTGPLIASLIFLNLTDPLSGSHLAKTYSLDLLTLIIPGGFWRYSHLTKSYWTCLPGNIGESSVYIGMSVISFVILVWVFKRFIIIQTLKLWYFILILFSVMSLGPVLHIWGKEISFIKLPYGLFENIFPFIKLSGVPVRMMIITTLAASIICAIGIRFLFRVSGVYQFVTLLLITILFIEYLPRQIHPAKIPVPEYIEILKGQPDNKGIIDIIDNPPFAMFYQTIHEKPISFPKRSNYIARTPGSTFIKDYMLKLLIKSNQYTRLFKDFNVKYIIVSPHIATTLKLQKFKKLFDNGEVALYDIEKEY